jgi:CubicO group peptidase (beta-lactamase class C family)
MQFMAQIPKLVLTMYLLGPVAAALAECGPIRPNTHQTNVDHGLDRYDELVIEVLNSIELLPGAAIGIVDENGLIYAKGFGVSEMRDCTPISSETGFYLLSTTKSFTGMLAAILQDKGIVKLDQSLSDYFPNLRMPAPLNPAQITLRQLLTHGKPFSNGALNFRPTIPANIDTAQSLYILSRYSTPEPPGFEYSNTGYTLASIIIDQASGRSWRELIGEEIFDPLEMTNSTAYMEVAQQRDFAPRYSIDKHRGLYRVPNKLEAQMHAAGGIVSTVGDLSRWLMVNLNEGRLHGRQVIPAAVVRQAHAPQIQFDWKYQQFRRYAYGLGVHHADYDGDLLIHHFGGAIHVSFMPKHHLGVIVLTNNVVAGGILTHRLAALTYDFLLKKPRLDERRMQARSEIGRSLDGLLASWEQQRQRALSRANENDPRIDEHQIAGVFHSDRLGSMEITIEQKRIQLRYGVVQTALHRLDGDTFTALFDDVDNGVPQVLDFVSGPSGIYLDWDGRKFQKQDL